MERERESERERERERESLNLNLNLVYFRAYKADSQRKPTKYSKMHIRSFKALVESFLQEDPQGRWGIAFNIV